MRVFQNSSTAGTLYGNSLHHKLKRVPTFAAKIAKIHDDGFDGVHTLGPVLDGAENAFYTHGDNEALQRAWAKEKGLPTTISLEDILLAQIEEHRTDVFYNMHLAGFDARFVERLPGSVKGRVAWSAVAPKGDMTGYLIVCNFPTILEGYRQRGAKVAYFVPAHDSRVEAFAGSDDRDIDVLFVGTYSRHHVRRAAVLEAVAGLGDKYKVVFALQQSHMTKLARTPLGLLWPLRQARQPSVIRKIAKGPVYGAAYHDLLGRSKIVLNGAIDISGTDRGNMRCFEALGTRSLLVSDDGNYPAGFVNGVTLLTYRSAEHAVEIIQKSLTASALRQRIADCGYSMLRDRYSKAVQWEHFLRIVAEHC